MITRSTVLILGAGASMPYKYPSGKELLINICDTLKRKNDQYLQTYALLKMGFTSTTMDNFCDALYHSQRNSVDAFLEWRQEYMEIGKACIAVELIPHEKKDLFEKDNNDNWYNYLFNKMNSSFDSFDNNKLAVITFNYDRSLEHYLFTALKNSYGKSDAECAAKLSNIPIIHVHGVLGYLPWQKKESRAYGLDNRHPTEVEMCYKMIKIIHGDITKDDEFIIAKNLIEKAKTVCFLGFGYNETNIARLRFSEMLRNDRFICGTRKGLTLHECSQITKSFTTLNLDKQERNCTDYLRNNPILE